ncbi:MULTISPECIES: redox-sensing transcriptional repressor Rex [unclassified Fusibacter]|uniref:redox-sensing transcriptional repressor Rex n=1 Tax=unclassified Fusibacter TaxID=2624464 RepID=UPI001011D616|nr:MULTISPECIES: redox-sensing transcriptional repressor Rex [unclassified Fusibacter]MCK8059443.1 redox-sensing transcriptional repressor Rex [Fusibacter sp. A2]NPE21093.1 redox-sensing transcriptional repressor Rex [Fusibacter sp. A1]RXV62365.1 redox-sensing transcriptional repressor Rex [Fusibacter sp. A1]
MSEKISRAVIKRLPKYHRYLKDLLEKDVKRISSKELSEIMGFTASQIRQDLNNFGGFGQQGYGYNVEELFSEIGSILGLVSDYKTIIIGAGNLGQALANYTSFEKFGFNLQAMFDLNPRLIGMKIHDVEVLDVENISEYLEKEAIDIAYICTNRDAAQNVAEKLVNNGIKAIWNFAPIDLKVPEDVIVENVHLIEDLFTISYFLKGASK